MSAWIEMIADEEADQDLLELQWDRLKLPQFNGYLYSATMSPKEYPNDETKKST